MRADPYSTGLPDEHHNQQSMGTTTQSSNTKQHVTESLIIDTKVLIGPVTNIAQKMLKKRALFQH